MSSVKHYYTGRKHKQCSPTALASTNTLQLPRRNHSQTSQLAFDNNKNIDKLRCSNFKFESLTSTIPKTLLDPRTSKATTVSKSRGKKERKKDKKLKTKKS
jgi:hypothetical protein